MTNTGSIGCSGSCSASAPSDSLCSADGSCVLDEGDSCTSSSNSCDMTNTGTVACSGECSATGPSDDLCSSITGSCVEDEGNVCTTLANSCGMTNAGTIACSGECSAETPLDTLCGAVPVSSGSNGSTTAPSNPGSSPESPTTSSGSFIEIVANISTTLEDIRIVPEVQRAITIAIPVAIVASIITAIGLATSFGLLSYLQFLFTSPFLFFARRKRKAYGVVYNAMTKVCVELVTVRLYDATSNRLMRSMVTDARGRYFFIANPGQYRIGVAAQHFAFPSTYLQNVKDDGVYLDVYTGQTIEVTEKDATIAANIPLDPLELSVSFTQKILVRRRFLRQFQLVLSISGVLLSIPVWFLKPSLMTALLAISQGIVFLLFWRLAQPRRPRGWGIVFDSSNHRPVGNAVVRLFEPKYNKLVETTLTDSLGRYSFFVGPNEYFVQANKEGFDEHIVRPIDYRQKTEPDAIAIDVPLTPTTPV